ncbi:NAD-dependent epimerase/dehydratase family protein [Porticoccaceae bacterium]|nr:NAD-dependent epimerase/dehydratase family protein [Porticoccaceae bacterium]
MLQKILVTGSAGFIGFHLVKSLLSAGHKVTGIDNLNDYYAPKLKLDRLDNLMEFVKENRLTAGYRFIKLDIVDDCELRGLFDQEKFDVVIHLAAQAGVRYSLENPKAYVASNLVGFVNILECCRHGQVQHFLFASSSSVYGMNAKQPFSVTDNTDYPISLYAATKKSNELLAHSYSHLFGLPTTGLRFFTVYGPYGRPDMAYFKFVQAINNSDIINVYNNGDMKRDFTYIDDIVMGIVKLVSKCPTPQISPITDSKAPFKIYNIGNNSPVTLRDFISAIESALEKKANEKLMPMQQGDVPLTYADIDDLVEAVDFKPTTDINSGIGKFVDWYLSYK